MKTNITKEILEELVKKRDVNALRDIFTRKNIIDLAQIVGDLDIREALFIFKVLTKPQASELFTYLPPEKQKKLVQLLTSKEISSILASAYADDIADLLDELPSDLAKDILANVPKERREDINELLSYKENSCGSIMGVDYAELKLGDTIGQAMEEIRNQKEVAESISYGYVVSRGKLVGTIALRDLILIPDSHPLKEEMETDFAYAKTTDDQEVAIDLIKKYDLTMLPIIDEDEKLVGVITADDIVDAMEEEATEDIHKMGAVVPVQTDYLETNPVKIAFSRLPWLIILMLSGSLSEGVITANNKLIVLFPILSTFIPMLMDTAGNAGSQSSSMVIRGIVVDKMDLRSLGKVAWKELRIALVCGGILFVVNFFRVWLLVANAGMDVALVSSLTLFAVVVMAKLVGGVLPLIANSLHIDPAVMASPIITTICDTVSLIIFFALAEVIL